MNPNHQNIGRKLREEALADSPDFSPMLHARIMQQIQTQTAPIRIAPAVPWGIRWAMAGAAAIAIAGTVSMLTRTPDQLPRPMVLKNPPTVPSITVEFPTLGDKVSSPLTEAGFGYLDRDAKSAALYVIGQFDVLPTKRG